jgi:hypothetical protein
MAKMKKSQTLAVSIARDWKEVYEAIWAPKSFPKWASGLSQSDLAEGIDGWWNAEGPDGPIRIRFSDHNVFGVMDHYVDLGNGRTVYVPMRIVANAEGAEVLLTLFREIDMSDERFAADVAWVERDLRSLQAMLGSAL